MGAVEVSAVGGDALGWSALGEGRDSYHEELEGHEVGKRDVNHGKHGRHGRGFGTCAHPWLEYDQEAIIGLRVSAGSFALGVKSGEENVSRKSAFALRLPTSLQIPGVARTAFLWQENTETRFWLPCRKNGVCVTANL